jgi:hypothetical protein
MCERSPWHDLSHLHANDVLDHVDLLRSTLDLDHSLLGIRERLTRHPQPGTRLSLNLERLGIIEGTPQPTHQPTHLSDSLTALPDNQPRLASRNNHSDMLNLRPSHLRHLRIGTSRNQIGNLRRS